MKRKPHLSTFPLPPRRFSSRLLHDEGLSIIRLAGVVDVEQCEAFRATMLGMQDRLGEAVVLDLTDLRFINVIGLGVVVRLGNAIHARGGRMMLHNAPPHICRLIRSVHLQEVFPPLSVYHEFETSPSIRDLATCA